MVTLYPAPPARDRWILERRPPRPRHDPQRAHGFVVEDERTHDGTIARVATVLLTGRECPWRCAMCDLWQYTLEEDTPRGAIPGQIADAMKALPDGPDRVSQIKLYNAGSFFDPRAVPEDDYDAVAALLTGLDRVIVESHPSLVGPRVDRFAAALDARLEVAMGLETVHPDALELLHKRMTVEMFSGAASRLRERGVALRVFLLIHPPFVPDAEQDGWLARSVEHALACGATAVSLIPTRAGNGAMEALAAEGHFRAPSLGDVERSMELALAQARGCGRVFVDLWDIERLADGEHDFDARRARLQAMNLQQRRGDACVAPATQP